MPRKELLAVLAATLLCATSALAQSPGAGATDYAQASAPPGHQWHRHLAEMRDPATFAKDRCVERFARSAGRLAYLEAKLDLTPEEKPLWDKWAQAMTSGSAAERQACLASVPATGTPVTVLDRDARIESLLSARLDTLKTARPALEALYHALTPDQRLAFDHRAMMGRPDWRHRPHRPEVAPL